MKKTEGEIVGRIIATELERQGITVHDASRRAKLTHRGLARLLDGEISEPKLGALRRALAVIGWDLGRLEPHLPPVEQGEPSGPIGRPKQ